MSINRVMFESREEPARGPARLPPVRAGGGTTVCFCTSVSRPVPKEICRTRTRARASGEHTGALGTIALAFARVPATIEFALGTLCDSVCIRCASHPPQGVVSIAQAVHSCERPTAIRTKNVETDAISRPQHTPRLFQKESRSAPMLVRKTTLVRGACS